MAFSATVISPMSGAERISRSLGVFAGKVSISSYSQTLVELTGVTRYFKPTSNATTGGFGDGIVSVQIDGPSSGGYIVTWDYTTGAFKCYSPSGGGITVDSTVGGVALVWTSAYGNVVRGTSAIGTMISPAASEAAANSAIGTFGFVAIGFVV